MLRELIIENFRCFDRHVIPFRKNTIVVGKNNAGKSTIIEALRFISLVSNRFQNLTFQNPPAWTSLPLYYKGVIPSIDTLGYQSEDEDDFYSERTIFHRYGNPPAKFTAKFHSGEVIEVYLGAGRAIFATVFNGAGKVIKTRSEAKKLDLPSVQILPQVAPLARTETILSSYYIIRSMSSPLSSRHFRNQLNLAEQEEYQLFEKLVETTWRGLKIDGLIGKDGSRGNDLILTVRDGDFTAEVGCMGHGLQMWLQTLWFISRCKKVDTIILDEPDVYLHPDLQRKLIQILKDDFKQVVIATHSVEILAEVESRNVLIIDRQKSHSRFADSIGAVQSVIDNIGGVHNLQLARLGYARKIIFVEGKDIKLLKVIHGKLFPNSDALDLIPNMAVGGWGGWSAALGAATFFHGQPDNAIRQYCIFDRDYHTESEINERYEKAKLLSIKLHIWSKKEIENYFLIPSAICRAIANLALPGTSLPNEQDVEDALERITKDWDEEVFDVISEEYQARNKGKGSKGANKEARKIVKGSWSDLSKRLSVVSGKKVFSHLSEWSKETYGVSLSVEKIAYLLQVTEIPLEMKDILTAIEQ